MPISLLTFGDAEIGRSLSEWGNEFIYAMGASFDFEKANFTKQETVVLNIVCLPPSLGVILNSTGLKRSSSEFWSTFNADYFAFSSRSALAKISTIKDALVGAIRQIPDKRMPAATKESFVEAAELAAVRLTAEPDRHPR